MLWVDEKTIVVDAWGNEYIDWKEAKESIEDRMEFADYVNFLDGYYTVTDILNILNDRGIDWYTLCEEGCVQAEKNYLENNYWEEGIGEPW